ncbi:hypothetical protein FRC19_002169 [Serendipita sp. 401]|nr:hypothetical protein FRC19_002169 [Serendipita sp. 401]
MSQNPAPDRSQLPDTILDLQVQLKQVENAITGDELKALSTFQRVANYMAAAMIYLRGNTMLEAELSKNDIKPRLLGECGKEYIPLLVVY